MAETAEETAEDAFLSVERPPSSLLRFGPFLRPGLVDSRPETQMFDLQGRMHQWFTSFDVLDEAGVMCWSRAGRPWLALFESPGAGAPVGLVVAGAPLRKEALTVASVARLCRPLHTGIALPELRILFGALTAYDPDTIYRYYYVTKPFVGTKTVKV